MAEKDKEVRMSVYSKRTSVVEMTQSNPLASAARVRRAGGVAEARFSRANSGGVGVSTGTL